MYHDLNSSPKDIFFNVHLEIMKRIMRFEDDDDCVEMNLKADNCIFISTKHYYCDKYLKEEGDKIKEFCEIQNGKYTKLENETALLFLRGEDDWEQKAWELYNSTHIARAA